MAATAQDLQAFLYRAVTANARLESLSPSALDSGRPTAPHVVEDFTPDVRVQAARMGAVYELLYCLENSARELIERTLRERLGDTDWWCAGVAESIRRQAEARAADDERARWHGPRGESLLDYTDFPQLGEIILDRWSDFEDLFGDRRWVESYFSEFNRSRRALAHTGQLTDADVERMELRVRDWLRVVG